ncbi:MAG: hypothetical protein MI867_03110 [Pseudomonadales bacterium]|nr:hypothetical protein [Pseudomonadales bacterium]
MALTNFAQPTWSITPEQGQQLNSVAFDAAGKNIVTGTSQEYGNTNVDVYCYQTDGQNVTLSWKQTIASDVQYGTFWVAMADLGQYCAAAGHTASDNGYIYVYDVQNSGTVVGEFNYDSRVSEIELTPAGDYFIAVQGVNVILGKNNAGSFTATEDALPSGAYMRTCGISTNSTYAVAAGAIYSTESKADDESSAPTGVICVYQNNGGSFTRLNTIAMPHEILRVAMTDDGNYFVATDDNGHVHFFSSTSTTATWSYTPAYACDLTYAAAIAYDTNQDVLVGVGTNISVTTQVQSEQASAFTVQPGLIYVLKDVSDAPQVLWQQRIEYPPNPGLNFDVSAKYLTCATGQPYDTQNETIGSFYLFDAATGFQYWRYDTSIMNWPMNINAQATACVGGSDSGTLYYWGQPDNS